MAISAVPYALQNGSHSADLFRQAVSSFVPPGGGLVTKGDLAITQTGTASMNIVFGVGRAWVPGTNLANVTGGNFSNQAMYYAQNDSAVTASVATSDPTNPRIDVAYIAIQDSQYAGTTNTAILGVATGVPTPGATYPANAPTIPANAIALAWISVAASAASILTANITTIPTGATTPALGIMPGRVKVTASGAGLTTLAVQNNIASFTFRANRRYKIVWHGGYSLSVATDYFNLAIQTCSTADAAGAITGLTAVQSRSYTANAAGAGESFYVEAIHEPASDTTLQIKFTVARALGSGTWTLQAAATAPSYCYIEDQGAQI
jgi:hypothetical protein